MITVRTDQSSSLPAPIADRRASPLNVLPDLQARKHAVSSSGCVRDLELASTTAGGPRTKTQILPSGSWGAPSGTGTSVVAGGGAGTGAGVGATVGSGARSVVEDAASPALPLGTGTGMGEGGDNQAAAALSGHRIVDEPKSEAGIRRLSLPNALVPFLEAHLAAYSAPGRDGFVFTRKSGLPLGRRELSEAWRQAVADVGVEAAITDLGGR